MIDCAEEVLSTTPDDPDAAAFIVLATAKLGHSAPRAPTAESHGPLDTERPERLVTYRFTHTGSSWATRTRFKDALRTAGFCDVDDSASLGSVEEIVGGGFWHHFAFVQFDDSPEARERADRTVRVVATEHGVDYDGWRFTE